VTTRSINAHASATDTATRTGSSPSVASGTCASCPSPSAGAVCSGVSSNTPTAAPTRLAARRNFGRVRSFSLFSSRSARANSFVPINRSNKVSASSMEECSR
jgi:hypothetical protein